MPSNRELKRLQSQNRDLRAEVERLESQNREVRAEVRRLADLVGVNQTWMAASSKISAERAAAKSEISAERANLAAARESLALVIAEAREDIADAETRLASLVERIEERGRRKERAQIGATVNRAVLGCQRARREIEAAVERHLNRQGAARPGMDLVLAAHNPTDAIHPEVAGLRSMDLPLLALPMTYEAIDEQGKLRRIRGTPVDQIILDERILDDGTSIGRYVEELPHETMAESAARADREGLDL